LPHNSPKYHISAANTDSKGYIKNDNTDQSPLTGTTVYKIYYNVERLFEAAQEKKLIGSNSAHSAEEIKSGRLKFFVNLIPH
jgi:hypothetical protein